jgi:hypothetical protein
VTGVTGIGTTLAMLHGWAGILAALLAASMVVVGALHGLGRVHGRRALDRLVLALLAATGVAAVLGIGVLIAVRPPSDALHLVYGAAAVLAVPAARTIAGMRRSPRLGWWLAAGGLVTLGALLRLWATGS